MYKKSNTNLKSSFNKFEKLKKKLEYFHVQCILLFKERVFFYNIILRKPTGRRSLNLKTLKELIINTIKLSGTIKLITIILLRFLQTAIISKIKYTNFSCKKMYFIMFMLNDH